MPVPFPHRTLIRQRLPHWKEANSMLKKIIALSLICTILILPSPVVAADNPSVTPTNEEILNEYHTKAFEAQTAAESGDTSAYARRGSSQTLELETVDALTNAGYEAYNVTGKNYDTQ